MSRLSFEILNQFRESRAQGLQYVYIKLTHGSEYYAENKPPQCRGAENQLSALQKLH